jgi:catechol 2,3-dioxygenase-like lactoylglutathione lyase family enzyme
MFDHIGIRVADLARSRAFYTAALAPLAITVQMEVTAEQTGGGAHVGFGQDGKPSFWIGEHPEGSSGIHIAFSAPSQAAVDAFYQAALAAGGEDNGAPGLRPHYHPNYFGAFILDPDGNNVEAVCHLPPLD